MVVATRIMAVLTAAFGVFSFLAYVLWSNTQAAATEDLRLATQRQAIATKELAKAVSAIPANFSLMEIKEAIDKKQTTNPESKIYK